MGETKTPVLDVSETATVYGPQNIDSEEISDIERELGSIAYYHEPRGLSENNRAYQTIRDTLSGERPLNTSVLGRIRRAFMDHSLPPFIVKQAIRDAAGDQVSENQELAEIYRFVTNFFTGHEDVEDDTARHGDLSFPVGKWIGRALCLRVDHEGKELFFPDKKESQDQVKSKTVCQECSVIDECLGYALENNLSHGIWGGMSEKQRRVIRAYKKAGLSGSDLQEKIVQIRSNGLRGIKRKKTKAVA